MNYTENFKHFLKRYLPVDIVKFLSKGLGKQPSVKLEKEILSNISPFPFNEMLHTLRTVELRRLPKNQVFLSAGCAGAWYFDWVQQACSPTKHIGIELYSPRPDDLPETTEWITASVGGFPQVQSRSVDIVFSGQNIEHLWLDDLIGFLSEAARVLRMGGLLVLDTPNREVTSPLHWTHPEHTAEFTLPELTQMLNLAGFQVDSVCGHWLIRDTDSGNLMPLFPDESAPREIQVTRRVAEGYGRPHDAFSIWIVSHLADTVDRSELTRYVRETWDRAREERIRRTICAPHVIGAGDVITISGEIEGFLFWGPYVPLTAGRYKVTWKLRLDQAPKSGLKNLGFIDVCSGGDKQFALTSLSPGNLPLATWTELPLEFEVDSTQFGIEFRLYTRQGVYITARPFAELMQLG